MTSNNYFLYMICFQFAAEIFLVLFCLRVLSSHQLTCPFPLWSIVQDEVSFVFS